MAKQLIFMGEGNAVGDALSNVYMNVFMGEHRDDTVLAEIQTLWPENGTFSGLAVYLYDNDMTGGTTTFELYDDNVATGIDITVPAGNTGSFSNTTDTHAMTQQSLMHIEWNTGTGGTGLDTAQVTIIFEPDSGNAIMFGGIGSVSLSSTGDLFLTLTDTNNESTTEEQTKLPMPFGGTATDARFYCLVNAGGACNITLRQNGADTNISIAVPASSTGAFTDPSDVTFVATDDLNWRWEHTGTDYDHDDYNLTVYITNTTNTKTMALSSLSVAGLVSAGNFMGLASDLADSAVLAEQYGVVTGNFTFDTAEVKIATAVGTNSVFTLYRNGADTDLEITATASTTGVFSDTTNSVQCVNGDLVCWHITGGSPDINYLYVLIAETANLSLYSREFVTTLPTTKADLATPFVPQEETDVATDDNVFVNMGATTTGYFVMQFKHEHTNATDNITPSVRIKSNLAPSASTVHLQIWNNNTSAWENLDSDSATARDVEFELSGTISASVANYYDGGSNEVAIRVYQQRT